MFKKFLATATAVTITATMLLTSTTFGAAGDPYSVTIMFDDEVVGKFETEHSSAGEFLAENHITIDENETVTVSTENGILEDGAIVTINSGYQINVTVDGRNIEKKVKAGTTVLSLMNELTEESGVDYYYVDGVNTTVVENGMSIELLSRKDNVYTTIETVPFEIEYRNSSELEEGEERIIIEGSDGTVESVVQVVFYGGVESFRATISEEVLVPAVTQVVEVGTAKIVPASSITTHVDNPESLKYSRVITMNASAYTAGPESTGKRPGDAGYGITASGMKVAHGVVAVDPNVIPLGTRLYVEGYGESIAADTGGAIKGNKIDLFYHDLGAALQFGRRNVTVYVLED